MFPRNSREYNFFGNFLFSLHQLRIWTIKFPYRIKVPAIIKKWRNFWERNKNYTEFSLKNETVQCESSANDTFYFALSHKCSLPINNPIRAFFYRDLRVFTCFCFYFVIIELLNTYTHLVFYFTILMMQNKHKIWLIQY